MTISNSTVVAKRRHREACQSGVTMMAQNADKKRQEANLSQDIDTSAERSMTVSPSCPAGLHGLIADQSVPSDMSFFMKRFMEVR